MRPYGATAPRRPVDPIAEATATALRTGRADRPIPTTIDGWTTVLTRAADNPEAARDLVRCLLGPAATGARAARNQSAIFESAVGACLKYQQGLIDNAITQNRITPDPDFVEMRESAEAGMGSLRTAIDAARKAFPHKAGVNAPGVRS